MGEADFGKVGDTLAYYERNAEQFAKGTVSVDFAETQNRFLDKLEAGSLILDFGCGSGRDTKYFLERGYRVEAIDGSTELCRMASAYTGVEVRRMLFQELSAVDTYDGIWACSSILHLPAAELRDVMGKMAAALKTRGIIYTSFKYGTFAGERNGRFFTDMTEKRFAEFLKGIKGLVTEEQWVSGDARPERSGERWLNLIMRKE
ncbi:MAG: class I SAM-dependent methyltransferase [Butyrivibrio sp.]|nr:class I SAM-dependent methyltransferase [Muribaculum sp.]MCM1553551.1 class I SAM-dependent methyltransferase [Butyrivibrio sp.]